MLLIPQYRGAGERVGKVEKLLPEAVRFYDCICVQARHSRGRANIFPPLQRSAAGYSSISALDIASFDARVIHQAVLRQEA